MRAARLAQCQLQHHAQHRVGQPRQLAGALLRVLAAVERGQGDAEAQCLPGFVEHHQRRFGVLMRERLRALRREVVALGPGAGDARVERSEEHTSELQSLMRISYGVFCLKKTKTPRITTTHYNKSVRTE